MKQTELVWSVFIRLFHWGLVLLFALAYYTSSSGDDDIHMILGYMVTVLLVLRIVYGVMSSGYGRFASFAYKPSEVLEHVRGIVRNKPDHYVGHSPAGSVMVFTLLVSLTILVGTGLVYQAWGEYEGPLWWLGVMPNADLAHVAWDVHRFLPDILIGLIVLHVLGVWLASVQHKENLARAMITGRKIKKGDGA